MSQVTSSSVLTRSASTDTQNNMLSRYDARGPRYTSYPTALQFHTQFQVKDYKAEVARFESSSEPLSLYIHIPFCHNICYYCACNKVVTNEPGIAETYLQALFKEIAMQGALFPKTRTVMQLHFGGGTPNYLTSEQMTRLWQTIAQHFTLTDSLEREYSIELDPRTTDFDGIMHLKQLGLNRVSLGVQDFDAQVQTAINRIQPVAQVTNMVNAIRHAQFNSMSFDLIYGLPKQTPASIMQTLAQVVALSPDRIACYSYAHLPERFKSQRAIDRQQIPNADDKLAIYDTIVQTLQQAGYVNIGMDHFVKPEDSLAQAQLHGKLYRNFQGYSTCKAPDLVGLGVSSIGQVGHVFAQNHKVLDDYYQAIAAGELPIERGIALDDDDLLRRALIMSLICNFNLDILDLSKQFNIDFKTYFSKEIADLAPMIADGLVVIDDTHIHVNDIARPLVRAICMLFDKYNRTPEGAQRFSRII